MTETEAAVALRDAMTKDVDMRRSITAMVQGAGCKDVYEWCEQHPDMAIALANQVIDIESQISEFETRLSQGDLS